MESQPAQGRDPLPSAQQQLDAIAAGRSSMGERWVMPWPFYVVRGAIFFVFLSLPLLPSRWFSGSFIVLLSLPFVVLVLRIWRRRTQGMRVPSGPRRPMTWRRALSWWPGIGFLFVVWLFLVRWVDHEWLLWGWLILATLVFGVGGWRDDRKQAAALRDGP